MSIAHINGKPWKEQYAFNTSQSGDIAPWTTGVDLPFNWDDSQAVITKNRVYLIGGSDNGGRSALVYYASINGDGTLGTWIADTSLPTSISSSQAIVTKDHVYLIGGYDGSTSTTIYVASVDSSGVIGTWAAGISLPIGMELAQAVVTKNRIYVFGGFESASVLTAPISENGVIGTWANDTSLPAEWYGSQAVITEGYVYLLGGLSGSARQSGTYMAPIDEDGLIGTWTTGTNLPGALGYSQSFISGSTVYLFGGYDSTGTTSVVYMASIDGSGVIGAWTTGTSLPGAMKHSQVIVTNSRIYMLGGGLGDADVVYEASLSGGFNDYTDYLTEDASNVVAIISPRASVFATGDVIATGFGVVETLVPKVFCVGEPTLLGSGDLIPLMPSVFSTGTVAIFGFGDIISLVPEILSIGEVSEPSGYGFYDSYIPSLFSLGTVSIIGNIDVKIMTASVLASGINPILGSFDISPKKIKVKCNYGGAGNFNSFPEINAYGKVSIICLTDIKSKQVSVSSVGQLSLIGVGNYITRRPGLSSQGLVFNSGIGDINVSSPAVSTYGYMLNVGDIDINSMLIQINCQAELTDDYIVIRYNRESVCH